MKTVKEFRDLGVEFVAGDECRDSTGSIAYTEGWYVCGNAGDELFDRCKVTRFAWRPINTMPARPKFSCDIDYENHAWRPSLDQSVDIYSCDDDDGEITVKYVDDKPVFTQAMADKRMVDLIAENVKLKEVIKILIGE